eukprot:scaffold300341_cov24-Attheya_sp.AAC.1
MNAIDFLRSRTRETKFLHIRRGIIPFPIDCHFERGAEFIDGVLDGCLVIALKITSVLSTFISVKNWAFFFFNVEDYMHDCSSLLYELVF